MGITKLAELVRSDAPGAVSHRDISDYAEKIIALDTSIVVNQFRAAAPPMSLLMGFFYRTLTFLEHGIKPVFVIDGIPPMEKTAVLEKRAEAAGRTSYNRTGAGALGFASSQMKNCLQLLKHMGVPVIQAPGDAEALCAQLVKNGTVDAVASEDMDTLPFGANILLRGLNASRDSEVTEYSLAKLLELLQISHEELIDLCILLGCDYCDKIPGLGPKKALTLIQKHRSIENVVLHINRETHPVPHFWKYKEARKIFSDVAQIPPAELTWTEPDEEALVGFLCRSKHGSRVERIRRRMQKYHEMRKNRQEERDKDKAEGRTRQTRMEEFCRVTRKRVQGNTAAAAANSSNSNKDKRPKLT